jgi:hypothetical protein
MFNDSRRRRPRLAFWSAVAFATVLAAVAIFGVSYFVRRVPEESARGLVLLTVQYLLIFPLPLLLGWGAKQAIERRQARRDAVG